VSKLNAMHIGRSVEEIVSNSYEAEAHAVAEYSAGLRRAAEGSDNDTRDLLEKIIAD
jgi:bacterioferritin (cytochrome b1)